MEEESRTDVAPPSPSVIRFGPYELDLSSAELRKGHLRIRLQDQPFQILLVLLEQPGKVVSRQEIRKKLWPNNTVVEFDHSINAAVKRLRDVLRDSPEKPRYIETLARRGYRFIGHVEAAAPVPSKLPADHVVPSLALPTAPGDNGSRAITGGPLSQKQGDAAPRRVARLRVLIPVFLSALLLTLIAGAWYYRRTTAARWARGIALPAATRLVNAGNYATAFPLLYRALQILPRDPALNKLRRETSHTIPIRTSPSGANVYIKPYSSPNDEWLFVGESPIENFLLPVGYFRWRITKPGFRTVEAAAGFQSATVEFTLDREGSGPPGMVHVPQGSIQFFSPKPVQLDDCWLDKYEVTNRQFKEFVDKGGYKNRQYWREEFVKDGRILLWEQAMAEFHDATGRAGPSIWELGEYTSGHDDFPVGGVSWYEALAYAEFTHKQIPTVYHWFRAANYGIWSDMLDFSNFARSGPVRVGSRPAIGSFGTYDMAGNVREWCLNAAGNRRFILGGAWNGIRVSHGQTEALSPFDRSPVNGFRCIRYPGGTPPKSLTGPVEGTSGGYATGKPVSDREFNILKNFYLYDHTGLNAIKESVDESSPYWRSEKITFDAAYGHQRVIAWLYVPTSAKPPYQTIIFHPAGSASLLGSIDEGEFKRFESLMDRAAPFCCRFTREPMNVEQIRPGRSVRGIGLSRSARTYSAPSITCKPVRTLLKTSSAISEPVTELPVA
jgi:DNA-binding winged helix-turn-helix (wHTH) protein